MTVGDPIYERGKPLPSYVMFITLDHRLECTKAKLVRTAAGETTEILNVEEPEFLSPRSCFNELLHGATEHQAVVKASRKLQAVEDLDA